MVNDELINIENKMKSSIKVFREDLAAIRTGHATPALIEHIKVDYAGVPTPLNHMAGISAPEAGLLVIQPWDKNTIGNIQKAIQKTELGLNPTNDGNIIRISIPPLSEERREELIKVVHKRVEERKVAIRTLRHEALNDLKKMEKDKDISQDELKRAQEQLQNVTDLHITEVEQIGVAKEEDLKEV
ncbi:MAG: ribosome recycling factor [Dehalococcoidia bacterium]|jgi:ribosome recycling factor